MNRIMEGYEIDILKEKPEECFPSDEGICAVWPNPARVAKKVGPIYFERIMPKVVKKGERFKVTMKIKAMEDIPSLKIEEKLPPGLKVYGSSSFEKKMLKKERNFIIPTGLSLKILLIKSMLLVKSSYQISHL